MGIYFVDDRRNTLFSLADGLKDVGQVAGMTSWFYDNSGSYLPSTDEYKKGEV